PDGHRGRRRGQLPPGPARRQARVRRPRAMRLTSVRPARPPRRAGFTLIELLIVISIIFILASLTLAAVFNLRESQMKNFTEATVQKLASALDQQWKAAIDQIREEPVPNA